MARPPSNVEVPPRQAPLPLPEARGLNREQAAAYVGVSAGTFDKMVREGAMPAPKRYGARLIWDRQSLDLSFAALPGDDSDSINSWDRVLK
jgi:excisionase family DNA binding protein